MPYLHWNDDLDVHVDAMNNAHKGLIDLMNQLYDEAQAKKPRTQQGKTLVKLADATTKHFREEEEYMRSIGYADYDKHSRIHRSLLETLAEHRKAFERGAELGKPFFHFLKLWLSSHIKGIDVKYGRASLLARAS